MFIDMNFRVEFEDEKKFVFHILPSLLHKFKPGSLYSTSNQQYNT